MNQVTSDAPARGTRPGNRKELVLDAAGELFHAHGFGSVSMGDIASAVNMAPSSLYRHFPSKSDLLHQVILRSVRRVEASLDSPGATGLEGLADHVASAAVANRGQGALWQREARTLPPHLNRDLREAVVAVRDRIAAVIRIERPDLLARQDELLAQCALGAVNSIAFHRLSLPAPAFLQLLSQLALTAMRTAAVEDVAWPGAASDGPDESRGRQLQAAATRLFAERGFAQVSVDELGASVGITGPSIYKHVGSKQGLLTGAMDSGYRRLDLALRDAEAQAEPEAALCTLTKAYVHLATSEPDVITVLIAESGALTPDVQRRMRRHQNSFISGWVGVLRSARPATSATEARIRVQAAQMVANDIGRTPSLTSVEAWRATVLRVAVSLQLG